MMQLVVLAAGRGTRLQPVTEDRSKAMAPVLGRPLVECAIEGWIDAGFTEMILIIAPDDTEIRSWFESVNRVGHDLRFVEQADRLGMAHALGLAAPHLRGDFALTACDSFVPTEHVRGLLSADTEGAGVLSLMDVDVSKVARSAAVELEGDRVVGIVEKPAPGKAPSNTVSLPHYILPGALLEVIPDLEPSARGEIELQEAIQRLIDQGVPFTGVRTTERRQVSRPEDLLRFVIDELRATGGMDLPARWLEAEVEGPVVIDRGARIGHDCVIGPNVFLEDGCVVGNGVTIRDAVVLRTAWVPTCSEIEGEVLV